MERYSSRAIDEVGRVTIHSELRKKLGLEAGAKISMQAIDTIVILRQTQSNAEDFVGKISELGMIELPAELRQQMGWKATDRIAVYNTDNLIILKTA